MSAQWHDVPEASDLMAPGTGDVGRSHAYGRGGLVPVIDTVEAPVPQVKVVAPPLEPSIRAGLTDPACRDVDPEIFFPVSEARSAADPARTICRRCPTETVSACLKYALTHAVEGVWGATTDLERDRLRQKFGLVAKPIVRSDREITTSAVQSLTEVHGQGARQIADQLGLTARTVVRHRQRIRAEGESA